MATACGGESLPTTGAASNVNGIVQRAVFEDGLLELRQCPFDNELILTAASSAAEEIATDDGRLVGEYEAVVYELDQGQPSSVDCFWKASDESASIGLSASEAPDDFDRFIEVLYRIDDADENFKLRSLGSSEHRGGTLERLCASTPDSPEQNTCEVSWYDDEMLATVYLVDVDAASTDLDAMEDGLSSVLDELVGALADAEADTSD